MILYAIDPGKKTGLAIFVDGVLSSAKWLDGDTYHPPPATKERPALVICERPEVRYSGGGRKSTGGDLITLAIRAGSVASSLSAGAPIEWATPSKWKGSVPKEIHHERIRKCLSPKEAAIFDRATGDARDAIGLGCWYLTRM